MAEIRYVSSTEAYFASAPGNPVTHHQSDSKLLLGKRVVIDPQQATNGWVPADTVPDEDGDFKSGFIQLAHISQTELLKVFYTDVGQGDATLIAAEGALVIIDGGPSRGFYDELKARLAGLRRADVALGIPPRAQLHINAVIISHFDKDHYFGLKRVIEDPEFTFGTIYHNGLPRYGASANMDLDLGDVTDHQDGTRSISTDLRNSATAQNMIDNNLLRSASGGHNLFSQFMTALIQAESQNRVGSVRRLVVRDANAPTEILPDTGPDMRFEVLGPVTTRTTGAVRLPVFPDPHDVTATNPNPSGSSSHTINGNSIVVRLVYGNASFLFGGDLNQPAQKYLDTKHGGLTKFTSDVNKACHHGSSDFDLNYMKEVNPAATVFSSGDNGSHDHPLPDAMGTAAKHGRGDFPLIFSTELIRDTSSSGRIMFGHINARSNGTDIVMAQKRERGGWIPFAVPYPGPFGGH